MVVACTDSRACLKQFAARDVSRRARAKWTRIAINRVSARHDVGQHRRRSILHLCAFWLLDFGSRSASSHASEADDSSDTWEADGPRLTTRRRLARDSSHQFVLCASGLGLLEFTAPPSTSGFGVQGVRVSPSPFPGHLPGRGCLVTGARIPSSCKNSPPVCPSLSLSMSSAMGMHDCSHY